MYSFILMRVQKYIFKYELKLQSSNKDTHSDSFSIQHNCNKDIENH